MFERKETPYNSHLFQPEMQLSMRYMDLNDLAMVLNWCKDEGWNVGQHDAEIYYKAAPSAHLLFLLDEEPVGAISIVQYSESFFTLGTFIVKKELRQRGYGAQIWKKSLELVDKTATIALYAVPAQIERYKKSGFESLFLAKRWEYFHQSERLLNPTTQVNGQLITRDNLLAISAYDHSIFGVSRQALLDALIKIPSITGFFLKKEEVVCGFGMVRPCSLKGYRVGPLFADTAENAKELFSQLMAVIGRNDIIIDIPVCNRYAQAFAEYFNLSAVPQNDTQAMARGDMPKAFIENIDKNFGLFSLEIG